MLREPPDRAPGGGRSGSCTCPAGSACTRAAVSRGTSCSSRCSAVDRDARAPGRRSASASTTISHSARSRWPIQRSRTSPDVEHARGRAQRRLDLVDQRRVDGVHQPPVDLAGGVLEHEQDRDGDEQADHRVGPVASRAPTPPAPSSTASEVKPSVRACRPSATSAAEPIRRPTPDAVRATSSLPTKPMTPATATAAGGRPCCGCSSRSDRLVAGDAADAAMISDDDDAGQVLGPAVAVGVAAGRRRAGRAGTRRPAAPRSARRRRCAGCRRAARPSRSRTTTTACRTAVTPQHRRARSTGRACPRGEDSSAESTLSAASCECGVTRCRSRPTRPPAGRGHGRARARGGRARGRSRGRGADVAQVVRPVVHEVAPQRLDREHRSVAAAPGPGPLGARHGVEPRGRGGGGRGQLAGDRGGVLLAVPVLRSRSRPGPSSRTRGRPPSSISVRRPANDAMDVPDVAGVLERRPGRRRRPSCRRPGARATCQRSHRPFALMAGRDLGGGPPPRRRTRTPGTAAPAPRSSPCCLE